MLPAQVSHLNLSPRAMPLNSFGGGGSPGGGGMQRMRSASFGSHAGGSPASFGTPQQFHSMQNSPQMGGCGADFGQGGAYMGPGQGEMGTPGGFGGGMGSGGGAGFAHAHTPQHQHQPAPEQEFVFTDEQTYPGRQVVQQLGEVEGYSNGGAGGDDALDAAIKSLVANAQSIRANGVLSMDVSEDQGGNVIVRGLAVVLA